MKDLQEHFAPNILAASCTSRSVLRHLTDRWTPMIVAVLQQGPQRFKDLKTQVEGISPKVLTDTLKSMERDGLISRTATASIPPRVDYELTALGSTLIEPMNALRTWAESHVAEVEANRASYDARIPL